jgi:hypothetical protein
MKRWIKYVIILTLLSTSSYAENIKGKVYINYNLLRTFIISGITDNNFFTSKVSTNGLLYLGNSDIGIYISNNIAFALGINNWKLSNLNYSYLNLPGVSGALSVSVSYIMPEIIYRLPTQSERSFWWISLGAGITNLSYTNAVYSGSLYAGISPTPTSSFTTLDLRFGNDYKISNYFYLIGYLNYQSCKTDIEYNWTSNFGSGGTGNATIDLTGSTAGFGLKYVFGGVSYGNRESKVSDAKKEETSKQATEKPNSYVYGKVMTVKGNSMFNVLIKIEKSEFDEKVEVAKVSTDMEGSYKTIALPLGTYTIKAWQQGYKVQSKDITIKDSSPLEINFIMTVK